MGSLIVLLTEVRTFRPLLELATPISVFSNRNFAQIHKLFCGRETLMITQVARTDALALRAAVLGLLDLKRLLAQEDECDELTYTSNKSVG